MGALLAGLGGVVSRALWPSRLEVLLPWLEGASVLSLETLDHETNPFLGERRQRLPLPPCGVPKPLKEVVLHQHRYLALRGLLVRCLLRLRFGFFPGLGRGLPFGLPGGVTD